jgi:uncharacterized protein YqhQ
MSKFMTIMLGVALTFGAATVTFAADDKKTEKKDKKEKKEKKDHQ